MSDIACCYLLENNVTKDQYVGITDNFERRKKEHSKGSNKYLKKDIERYSWNNFSMKKLIIGSREYCTRLEIKLINKYNCIKYNIAPGGTEVGGFGEGHPGHKLTKLEVRELRNLYSSEDITMLELANGYGISLTEVSKIISGKVWKSVTGTIDEKNKSFKLTNKEKETIRKKYKIENITLEQLAKQNTCSASLIAIIVKGIKSDKIKLKSKDILAIRNLYMNKKYTQKEISNNFNVSRGQISKIILGNSWKEVGGPIKGIDYD